MQPRGLPGQVVGQIGTVLAAPHADGVKQHAGPASFRVERQRDDAKTVVVPADVAGHLPVAGMAHAQQQKAPPSVGSDFLLHVSRDETLVIAQQEVGGGLLLGGPRHSTSRPRGHLCRLLGIYRESRALPITRDGSMATLGARGIESH